MTATDTPPGLTGHPVSVAVAAELADDLADRSTITADAGLAGVADLLGAIDRLLATVVTVLIGADRRAVIAAEGLTLPSWLRSVARRTGADAGMLVAAAERLADMPATLAAFQRGVLSWGTVRGIVSATRPLTADQRRWLDDAITADRERLARVDADTLVADAEIAAERVRPDLQSERADRAAASQQLVLQPSTDGGGNLYATLDAETFAAVTAAIEGIVRDGSGRRVASNVDALRALARQRVTLSADTDTDADADTDAVDTDTDTDTETDAVDADTADPDDGDSAVAATDTPDGSTPPRQVRPAPSTARPEMIVVTDIHQLADPDSDPVGSGIARLLWNHDRPAPRLTGHAARRLACDATIRPVLVDQAGRVLGTAEPYARISASLRAALAARDGGCRFTGCHAPVEVCDAHHLQHRVDGGTTTMANLALLCGQHHRAVHEGGWKPTLDIATGAMTFTRRGTTLHSHPRLPSPAAGLGAVGPPPRGRPRRHRPGEPPPDPPPQPARHKPADARSRQREPLPF